MRWTPCLSRGGASRTHIKMQSLTNLPSAPKHNDVCGLLSRSSRVTPASAPPSFLWTRRHPPVRHVPSRGGAEGDPPIKRVV